MRRFNNLYCVYIMYETKNEYTNRKEDAPEVKESKDNEKRNL